MANYEIRQLKDHVGEIVDVRGWLYNRRGSGKILFLQVRDGTGTVQAVAGKNDVTEAEFNAAKAMGNESSLIVTGEVKAEPRSPIGVELLANKINLLQDASH